MEYYRHFKLRKARGDGSCFYSAIYRAARDHTDRTLLNRVYQIFEIPYVGEESQERETDFIKGVSGQISRALEGCIYFRIKDDNKKKKQDEFDKEPSGKTSPEGKKEQINTIETIFEKLYSEYGKGKEPQRADYQDDKAHEEALAKYKNAMTSTGAPAELTPYQTFLEETANEIRQKLGSFDTFKINYPKTKEGEKKFYLDIAHILDSRQSGSFIYASQIDIDVVSFVLEKNDIVLISISDKKRIIQALEKGKPTLWLSKALNGIQSQEHYDYYEWTKEEDDPDWEEEDEDEDEDDMDAKEELL
jgi:hypothetical protein